MSGKTVEDALSELQRKYSRYKLIERDLQEQRIRYSTKLPDVQRSLEAVEMLCEKRDVENAAEETLVKYQLTEATFADASVTSPESVYLWLGANVMLEYPLDEAKELLETNVHACERGLEAYARDLAVLKDNMTIVEVNMSRIYNYDVRKRRNAENQAAVKAK